MLFPIEFFRIQLAFAARVQALAGIALEQALLEYTNFYVRFGCGREFDANHGTWRNYLDGLAHASDPCRWTYEFYLADAETRTRAPVVVTIGCFSYELQEANRVRLHFRNADTSGYSPLHVSRVEARRAEIAELFAHVRRTVAGEVQVLGTSWLYNLDAYRRLFPARYTTSGTVVQRFRSMPLWGQFVDHAGRIKAARAEQFLKGILAKASVTQLPDAFPLQPLAVHAPAQCFYEHYGV